MTRETQYNSHFLDPRQRAAGSIFSTLSYARHKTHASGELFSGSPFSPLDPLQNKARASCRTSIHLPEYQFAVPSRGDNAAVASSAPKPCAAAATIPARFS